MTAAMDFDSETDWLRAASCFSLEEYTYALSALKTFLSGALRDDSSFVARFWNSVVSQANIVDMICCRRFMPSLELLVRPIQLVMAVTESLASTNLTMPLIMVAAFPTRNVCLMTVYGMRRCRFSRRRTRYWPSGDITKTWWRKDAALV
jgi:hypothetical protein